jgi:hypothetical protein
MVLLCSEFSPCSMVLCSEQDQPQRNFARNSLRRAEESRSWENNVINLSTSRHAGGNTLEVATKIAAPIQVRLEDLACSDRKP